MKRELRPGEATTHLGNVPCDVVELLERRAAEAPDSLLLAWEPLEGPAREWTSAAFADNVRRAAGALAARGVAPGERVLLQAENSPEFLLTWFACAWIGAVCVVLNPKSAPDELGYFARHTDASGLVAQAGLPDLPDADLRRLRWTITLGGPPGSEESLATLRGEPAARVEMDASSPGSMLFTSGTTSRPKAVLWSRANPVWAARSVREAAALSPEDIALVFLPLYHVAGLAWSVLPAIESGAAIVLQPRFSASRFWEVALRRKATFGTHVQFSSGALSRQTAPERHSFRLWCNSTWLPEYEAHFRVPIVGWWGMTELVAPGILGQRGVAQQPGSIGFAAPGYELRIADGAKTVEAGETGELEVKGIPGQTIFSRYWRDEQATAAAFTPDSWFRTGDRMRVHDDGSIRFFERSRDVIKTGGEGVSPAEVERVVRAVPGVAEVSLVGRADAAYGEVGVAFVVAAAQELDRDALAERILAACTAQLAAFKVPRQVRFIDALPLAGINKVAKGELRRLASLTEPVAPSSRA